jgi:hypothetical protein
MELSEPRPRPRLGAMKKRTRRWLLRTFGLGAAWFAGGLKDSLAGKVWDRLFEALTARPLPPPVAVPIRPAARVITAEGHVAGLAVARAVGVAVQATDSIVLEFSDC